jgi:hypothetical protein
MTWILATGPHVYQYYKYMKPPAAKVVPMFFWLLDQNEFEILMDN